MTKAIQFENSSYMGYQDPGPRKMMKPKQWRKVQSISTSKSSKSHHNSKPRTSRKRKTYRRRAKRLSDRAICKAWRSHLHNSDELFKALYGHLDDKLGREAKLITKRFIEISTDMTKKDIYIFPIVETIMYLQDELHSIDSMSLPLGFYKSNPEIPMCSDFLKTYYTKKGYFTISNVAEFNYYYGEGGHAAYALVQLYFYGYSYYNGCKKVNAGIYNFGGLRELRKSLTHKQLTKSINLSLKQLKEKVSLHYIDEDEDYNELIQHFKIELKRYRDEKIWYEFDEPEWPDVE